MGTFPLADNLLSLYGTGVHARARRAGRRIGRVKDAALVPMVSSSASTGFWSAAAIPGCHPLPTRSVPSSWQGIVLNDEVLTPYHDDEYMLRIGRDLLDQQIIA